jgi:hypothetical protein
MQAFDMNEFTLIEFIPAIIEFIRMMLEFIVPFIRIALAF